MFETKVLEHLCYPIVVVYLPSENMQKDRLIARTKMTEDEAYAKIKSQMKMSDKIAKADLLLDNSKSKEDLLSRVTASILPGIKLRLK